MDHPTEENGTKGTGAAIQQMGWMIAAAVVLGIGVDILFHGERLGISFSLWAMLSIAAMLLIAWKQAMLPKHVLLLPAAILVLSAFTAVRLEPMSTALNIASVLVLFAVWVRDFRAGQWLDFGWVQLIWSVISVPVEALFRPWRTLAAVSESLAGENQARKMLLAVLRGLLITIPIVMVFGVLLSAADVIFSDTLENILSWFDWAWFRDAIGHVLLILFAALFSLGAMVTALTDRPVVNKDSRLQKVFPPFIGMIETFILLGAVDALFLLFVSIQFRYFFGGAENISAAGYTYADYARQGFSELVLVAFLSLGLILALSRWSKRKERKGWFNGLSVLLVGEVGVMLVSAFNRLLLYEEAYGFTRLRLYTHAAILWLGITLAAFLVLLLIERIERTVLLAGIAAVGFILTLDGINVDASIVQRNHLRYLDSGRLDTGYFLELSFDAVPAMVEVLDSVRGDERETMLANLACQRTRLDIQMEESGWPSTHFSRIQADAALTSIEDELEGYDVNLGDSGWIVRWDGGEQYCGWYWD